MGIEPNGSGTYRFAVELDQRQGARSILISVDGALAESVAPATALPAKFAWRVVSSGVVTISLAQLTPSQRFRVKLLGEPTGGTATLDVEAKALSPKISDKKE